MPISNAGRLSMAIAIAALLAAIGPAHGSKYGERDFDRPKHANRYAERAFFNGPKHANRHAERDFEIRVLSSRSNTISGGDALIEVHMPRYASSKNVVVRLNGSDVSGQLHTDPAGDRLIGLVTGLRDGKNRLTVSAKHHHHNQGYDSLELINYPIYGEIFAPHQRPWVCETEASGLGAPPASGPCLAPTRYEWYYRNTSTSTRK